LDDGLAVDGIAAVGLEILRMFRNYPPNYHVSSTGNLCIKWNAITSHSADLSFRPDSARMQPVSLNPLS
jgi:hypothetical protein